MRTASDLNGLQKASILMMEMGTAASAAIFKQLSEEEIEQLATEMMKLRRIDSDIKAAVVAEFKQVSSTTPGMLGGKDFAAQVLEQALGEEKAKELLEKAGAPVQARPFRFLWDIDPRAILRMISNEHPQVIALILSNLPPEKAAVVLGQLDEQTQVEVALRIVSTGEADPSIVAEIEEALKASLSTTTKEVQHSSTPEILVEILNNAERSTERLVLDALNNRAPEAVEQVRKKMFLFEDLLKLTDRAVQMVLREVDQDDLRMALKGAEDEIKDLVYRNMSERAAQSLRDDLEMLQQPRIKDIEFAQQRIAGIARKLIASGDVSMEENEAEATLEPGIDSAPQEEQAVA